MTPRLKPFLLSMMPLLLAVLIVSPAFSETPQAVFQRGMQAYSAGRTDEAISLFKQSVDADPRNADALYNLGALYYKKNMFAEALTTFNRLLVLSPNDQSARFHAGTALEKQGRFPEAIAMLDKIPQGSPRYDAAQAHINYMRTAPQTTATVTKPTAATSPTTASNSGGVRIEEFSTGYSGPTGIDQDAQGNIYVANYSKHCIEKVNEQGQHFTLVCNSGIKGPVGLIVDKTYGNLYVANHLDNTIARVSPDGKVSIITNQVKQPYNLFLDERHRVLYVTQQKSNSVAKIHLQ